MTPFKPNLEELETRVNPARMVNRQLVVFRDLDGDRVEVRISKPLFTAANINNVLKFSNGAVDGKINYGQQLQKIDLKGLAAGGTTLTVQGFRWLRGSNGLADVGFIDAAGRDLLDVIVDGDVGRILVGNANPETRAIRQLRVGSMGVKGLTTQEAGGTLESIVHGWMAGFRVDRSMVAARLRTEGGSKPDIGNLHIGGFLRGGTAVQSGEVLCAGVISNMYIGKSIVGGGGVNSGQVVAGVIRKGLIRGSVVGGSASFAGQVFCNAIGNLQINGMVKGGSAFATGQVFADRTIVNLTIKGSVIGGTASRSGGIYINRGRLVNGLIQGHIRGGSIAGSSSVNNTGYVQAMQIRKLIVRGSIFAGRDNSSGDLVSSGAILAGLDITQLVVGGSLVGNPTHFVTIAAAGAAVPTATTDYAIGTVTIRGHVRYTQFLAGWLANMNTASTPAPVAVNPDAQVKKVTVLKDWVASNLVAGAVAGADGLFGTADDELINSPGSASIRSRIDSLWIQGRILGTAADGDHFGIVAEHIVQFKRGKFLAALNAGRANDVRNLAPTGDVKLREI